jgi:putative nucleotidyltransferase with HDIG domain
MKKIFISDLKPGMILAKDVYNHEDGRLLLLKGFSLKPNYIDKLASLCIMHVYIDDESTIIKEEVEEISEAKVFSEAFSTIKDILTSVREGNSVEVAPVKETVDEIVQKVINNQSVFMQLTGIRDIDNYTFHHSVDVCIYSLITGKSLGLSVEELTVLGMGAILHDIGKCKIPLEILLKPGKLTDDEFMVMKLHTVYGYEIIYNTDGLTKQIANIACQHHEKWDGAGYPAGLRDNQIDRLARIVAVSDVYDALTADRCYRKKDLPHVAAEYVIGNSGKLFDPEIAKVFINNISLYPENCMVLLNTGEIGSILDTNNNMALRPKIKIIAKKNGPPLLDPYTVDLMSSPSVFIVEILS